MGLLDSNKMQQFQKSGNCVIDLSSEGDQGSISFAGSGFNVLSLNITNIAEGADIIITVVGSVVSNAYALPVYNENGDSVTITTNGNYYVDVSGLTIIIFRATRRIQSGTASINWSLTNTAFNPKTNNTLQNMQKVLNHLPLQESSEIKTYDVSAVGNLETFSNSNKCGCFTINVTELTSGALLTVLNIAILYDVNGNIISGITNIGVYYAALSISVSSVTLRCHGSVSSGTAKVKIGWMNDVPASIAELKPVQLMGTFSSDITSNSKMTLVQYSNDIIKLQLKRFKYFFYSYYISNNNNAATRLCHINIQPYHNYNGSYKAGKDSEISLENSYSFQSAWLEINGDSIRVFVKLDNYVEGDNIIMNIYGVR